MEAVTLETIYKELETMKKDIEFIKHALAEEYELSEEAKKGLAEARATPESEYINQEEMEKEFL
ncbi:MAG: hypothetical protein QMD21_00485 [Candidatus Thermoplasmatota archaeon]|nr:hypothetical protein [Candidatus Thermoplasmatota archaeon]MDI6855248.1 hypothetical protein [Candidatus Thermoplasmatota archaeon]